MKQNEIIMVAGGAGAVVIVLVVLMSGMITMSGSPQASSTEVVVFRDKVIDSDSPPQCIEYYMEYENAQQYDIMVKAGSLMKFDKEC